MMVQIVEVETRGGTRVHLRFDDGAAGDVDLADVVRFEGVFAALSDSEFFERVVVDDDWGTLCWPGGIDLAPEPLHALVMGRTDRAPARATARVERAAG